MDATANPVPAARRLIPKAPKAGWVGPLFKWELVRLARRGQDARARFILAVALLFVLTAFTLIWFPHTDPSELFFGTSQTVTLNESAKFADSFALTFILAQLAVLVLLAPAYAAGAISEEKEKRTFTFLLVSDLTNREIVFGKFLGRLAFLLGVMVAGLPVLALTQLYGGVSLKFLLMGYFLTATTVTVLTAVSAAAAAATDTFRGALFRAYGLTALHVLIGCGLHPVLSPFGIVALLFSMEANSPAGFFVIGLGYGSAQLAVAAFSVWLAVRWVRKARALPITARSAPPPRTRLVPRQERWDDRVRREREEARRAAADGVIDLAAAQPALAVEGEVIPTARPVAAAERNGRPEPTVPKYPRPDPPRTRRVGAAVKVAVDRPRVYDDDPFYWKERYTTGTKRTADDDSIRGVLIAVGVMVAVVVAFFALIGLLALAVSGFSRNGTDAAASLMMTAGAGGFFVYLLTVGAAAGGSVVRERQRQTLETLLSLPVARRAILWPKWRVSITRGWWWGVPALLVVPLGLLLSEVPTAAFPGAGFVLAAVPFTVSLALWLSVRCKTVTRAVLWMLPAVAVLSFVPVVAWRLGRPEWDLYAATGVGIMALAAAAGAVVFWALALLAFEREGR